MIHNSPRWTRRNLIGTGAGLAAAAAIGRTAVAQTPVASPPATSYPITVAHDGGETTLESQPQRIVALEWHLVEDLLVMGIQPVAIADVEGFKTWVTIDVALADDVQDVGTRQEPSLESLEAAEPDLILGLDYRDIAIYDSLAAVAPTILMSSYPQEDGVTPLENVRDRLRQEGWFLDNAEAVEAAIATMDAMIEDQAAEIDEAGLTGIPYVVTQMFTAENQPTMRIFNDGALIGDAISATGLENVWTAEADEWGFTTNTIESFIEFPEDVNVFYIVNGSDDVLTEMLNDDPIWQSLSFVQEGRFYPLGGDTWTFGGTQSVERIVTRSTAQITGTASEA
ncbi:MAG: iron-siderophore ABC transporter substrate-binding protein [Chloroflexota bacterium]|nr:iron-siderophore ABC transporter substrate-binding protein [Chloroflexota bacterium]